MKEREPEPAHPQPTALAARAADLDLRPQDLGVESVADAAGDRDVARKSRVVELADDPVSGIVEPDLELAAPKSHSGPTLPNRKLRRIASVTAATATVVTLRPAASRVVAAARFACRACAARSANRPTLGSTEPIRGAAGVTRRQVGDEDDDYVVGVQRSRAERDGKRLDVGNCIVFKLDGGRVVEIWEHFDDLYVRDEFWS